MKSAAKKSLHKFSFKENIFINLLIYYNVQV